MPLLADLKTALLPVGERTHLNEQLTGEQHLTHTYLLVNENIKIKAVLPRKMAVPLAIPRSRLPELVQNSSLAAVTMVKIIP
jgi:hypothetical protein